MARRLTRGAGRRAAPGGRRRAGAGPLPNSSRRAAVHYFVSLQQQRGDLIPTRTAAADFHERCSNGTQPGSAAPEITTSVLCTYPELGDQCDGKQLRRLPSASDSRHSLTAPATNWKSHPGDSPGKDGCGMGWPTAYGRGWVGRNEAWAEPDAARLRSADEPSSPGLHLPWAKVLSPNSIQCRSCGKIWTQNELSAATKSRSPGDWGCPNARHGRRCA